jgi:hypothetical protein
MAATRAGVAMAPVESDTRDENTSDYSPSGSGEGGGDPVRAALYGDAGYGQGLTGAQTAAFDNVLAATGDIGQALDAMDAAAPNLSHEQMTGLAPINFGGGFGGGFGGFGTGLFSQINLDAITAYVNAKNGGASEEEAMAAMNAVAAPAPAPTATATAPAEDSRRS